jgi:hypothetical protein
MAITWEPTDAAHTVPEGTRRYEFPIPNVDRLIIEILKRVGLNPKFFVQHRLSSSGREALEYQNPHAADWLS